LIGYKNTENSPEGVQTLHKGQVRVEQ